MVKKLFLSFFLLLSFLWSADNNKLEIGFVYWKKDKSPEKYNAYVYGINKAISEINSRGGLNGEKLALIKYNEKGKVEESIKIAKNIAKRDRMIAVIGFSNSNRAKKAIKYVSEAGIPIISSAGSKKVFESDIGSTFFTTNFGIHGEILYLKKFINVKGYNKILFISKKEDGYSDEYFDEVSKIVPNNKRVYADNFKLEDVKNYVDDKTLIIISINVSENAKYSNIIRKNGITNDIFFGRGGIVGKEFYDAGGYGLKNIYELSTLLAGVSNETLLEFEAKNKKFFSDNKNKRYLEYSAYAYDCVYLILDAFKKTSYKKIDDPKVIRSNIIKGLYMIDEKHPFDGIATTYSFGKDRVGGKLIPQYILESTGKRPSLYKKQFIYQNGRLVYVPTLYTNIDIKSINIDNQEASQYTIEMMVTLISEKNIQLRDLEFENIMISDSSFKPAIYSKEFIIQSNEKNKYKKLNVNTYIVKATFNWNNSIENFPFDKQKIVILIKPKDPIHKNFINFFISDINKNLNSVSISGWDIVSGYAGFKKGYYEYINSMLEPEKSYYYRSSYTIDMARKAFSSAVKFILPLTIVLIITLVLYLLPDNAGSDKVGTSTSMVITIVALYFTYATIVDVDYITFIDKLYIGSLLFVLLTNIIFIIRQRFYHSPLDDGNFDKPCFAGKFFTEWIFNQSNSKTKLHTKVKFINIVYFMTFIIAILSFIYAFYYFIEKAYF